MNFNELNLKNDISKALVEVGYETPTQIQYDVIKESVSGNNIIGQSQTGTGKTAAFVISLLQNIDLRKRGTQVLIIAPTRELVTQIREEIFKLSKYYRVKSLAVYGGSNIKKQIDLIKKGQDIIVGTPGRVIDLIERKVLKLEHINYFVLDEVDRMLDMGFIDDIDFIWHGLTNLKQVFSFSATITQEIKDIIQKYLGINYVFIKSTDSITTEKINHSFVETPTINKYELLHKFINKHKSKKTLVFVETKIETEKLAKKLIADSLKASFLNGDMRQRERFKALRDFQEGNVNIFVVTDVAARGLNMKNIELVVNYDVPTDPETYIHRIGRTGRAGASGNAIMFVSGSEKYALKNIERRNKISLKQVNTEGEEIERKEEKKSTGRSRFGSRGNKSGNRFERKNKSSFGARKDFGEKRSFGSKKSFYKKSDETKFGENKKYSEKKGFSKNNDEKKTDNKKYSSYKKEDKKYNYKSKNSKTYTPKSRDNNKSQNSKKSYKSNFSK